MSGRRRQTDDSGGRARTPCPVREPTRRASSHAGLSGLPAVAAAGWKTLTSLPIYGDAASKVGEKGEKRENSLLSNLQPGWKRCFDAAFTVSVIQSARRERSQCVLRTGIRPSTEVLRPTGRNRLRNRPSWRPPGSPRDAVVSRLRSPKVRGRGARTQKVTAFVLGTLVKHFNSLPVGNRYGNA